MASHLKKKHLAEPATATQIRKTLGIKPLTEGKILGGMSSKRQEGTKRPISGPPVPKPKKH
jgi:hypothetical protein